MEYPKCKKYDTSELNAKIMGPHPLKLLEELMSRCSLPAGSTVLDLGSGQGLTSVFLAREYGYTVYAADLWSEPEDNRRFFDSMGLSHEQIIPIKADATDLKFEHEFFDGVISTDSYNYFGRDKEYLDRCLLPFVKSEGYIFIVVPGMKRDCHDSLPPELLLSWNAEQLDYIHDAEYWRKIVSACRGADILSVYELESNENVWADWLAQENEYAVNDRKSMNAGGGKYMNFIGIILKKQK